MTLKLKLSSMLIATGFLLAGCAEVQFLSSASKEISNRGASDIQSTDTAGGNGTHYKIGKSYKIKGQWYYPQEDYQYIEEGIASWYGPNFHGKKTANGAIFDMNKISAAHRTLPMPSIVRVTNLENGRSLVAKVNDRGPFAHNRIIDMSKRGAQLLGFERQGTALVRVEILEAESRQIAALMQNGGADEDYPIPQAVPSVTVAAESLDPPSNVTSTQSAATINTSATAANLERESVSVEAEPKVETVALNPSQKIYIQAGAFSQYENARRTKALLESVGTTLIQQYNQSDTPLFRVRLGPLPQNQTPDSILTAVQNAGFPNAKIIVDNQ